MARPIGLVVAATVLAAVASLFWLVAPSVTESRELTVVTSGSEDQPVSHQEIRSRTLAQAQGPGVIGVLMIPVAVALAPLPLMRTRLAGIAVWVAAGALWILCVLGALSIGLFYLPAASVMLIAALCSRGANRAGSATR